MAGNGHGHADRLDRAASALLTALALALGLALALWTALLWYRYHSHIPWRDIYLIVKQVMPAFEPGFGAADLATWFDLHYSAHRIFVPRVLVAFDLAWFHGQNHLIYTVGWLCLGALVALFAALARTARWPNRWSGWLLGGLAAAYLFSPAHLWNLVNPVNNSWHITMAASAAAVALLTRPGTENRPGAWLAAMFLAAAAAFSTFAGVVTWLFLPLLALLGRSRFLLPVAVASALFIGFYCRGIHSDAAIMANWSGGPQALLDNVHQQGLSALAGNTPWQVLRKTIDYLGWPLARDHRPLANALALGSLVPVAGYAGIVARRWWRREPRTEWLVGFSLMLALLCIAIAVTTQVGRIIPQPVHVQGPSQERFQTVVLLYWTCVTALALAAVRRLPPAPRLAAGMACLTLPLVLSAPGEDYLREEILSMEYAARLQALGERARLRETVDRKSLLFRPERIFTLDAFLHERQLAYHAPLAVPPAPANLQECGPQTATLTLAEDRRPGVDAGTLLLHGPRRLLAREVTLYTGGALTARFSPVHTGNYTPLALLDAGDNRWEGLVEIPERGPRSATLVVRTPLGLRPYCRIVPAG